MHLHLILLETWFLFLIKNLKYDRATGRHECDRDRGKGGGGIHDDITLGNHIDNTADFPPASGQSEAAWPSGSASDWSSG